MTREEFIIKISEQLVKKNRAALSWTDITAAVAQSSVKEKELIVSAFKMRDPCKAGKILQNIILQSLKNSAVEEAESLMIDNTLTIDEINRIFG